MNTSLQFGGDLSPTLAILLAVAAAATVFLFYRLETRGYGIAARWLLPTMRSLAVMLVILLLAGPVLLRSKRIGTLGEVVFVVDRSGSMEIADLRDGPTRSERVRRVLKGGGEEQAEDGLLAKLQSTHDVSIVDSGVVENETDLAQLLANALEPRETEGPQQTIVLISDGQNNAGDSPIELVEQLAGFDVVTATWGFGETEEPDDLAILEVVHPDRISATSRLRGSIRYKRALRNPESVELFIQDGEGAIVWSKVLDGAEGNDGEADFEFSLETLVEQAAGATPVDELSLVQLGLQAGIRPVEGSDALVQEKNVLNNSHPFSLLAVRSDYRILIVDGRSRWETRYLKNLFSRDPQWQANVIVFSSDELAGETNQKASQALPDSLEDLLEYDLVCLGEVKSSDLTERFRQWLPDYVSRGGGLILVDGQRDELTQTLSGTLAKLAPVRWRGAAKPFYADSLVRTSVGNEAAWLTLGDSVESSEETWQQLPPPRSMRLVEVNDDAEILVEADLGGAKYPVVVTKTFGGGRIVYFASDETWRWRYKVADEIHARFWNQMSLALIQPPLAKANEFAQLDAGKSEYRPGERAKIRVRLRNPDGSFNNDANVEATLSRGGETVQVFSLKPDGRLPGMYAGESGMLGVGEYEVRFTAAGYGDSAQELSAAFSVVAPASRENLRVAQNDSMLKELAAAGRGRYFTEDQQDDLLRFLEPRSGGRIEQARTSLWDSYYWFIPIVCLLAGEWWLRKRVGLP